MTTSQDNTSTIDTATTAPLARRQFLKVGAAAGGGLVVSFALPSLLPGALAAQPAAAATREAPGFSPNAFIRIDTKGQVVFVIHKVEMGQGTFTSLPMLLAEELEVDPAKVKLEQAPPDGQRYADPLLGGQITGGSTSIRGAWVPLRTAGATARTMLVAAAAQRWKVEPSACSAKNGVVTHTASGRTLGYGQLADAAAKLPVPKDVKLKDAKDFTVVGTPLKRLDGLDKGNGRTVFGIDIRLPGMKYATVAASPVVGGTLLKTDDAKALAVKGVRQIVKLDNAVAVVGDHMWAAKQGLAALAPTWTDGPNANFSTAAMVADMDAASMKPGAVARHDGDPAKVLAASANKLEAIYQLPFLAHATMEPINCTVDLKAASCDIYVGTQVPTFAQGAAAKLTGLPLEKVNIHNQYLGGGFGRRLEIDSVVQAVSFAKQVKGPVKFVWTREEDVQHDMYRPYYYDRLSAALDDKGNPAAWTHRVTGSSILSRFAPPAVVDGVDPDAVEGAKDLQYTIPNVHVDYVRYEPPVPTAFWRGVGPTHNVFVVESFMDELAHKAGKDPFEYRRALLDKSPRAKAVLELAAAKAGWGTPLKPVAGSRTGRGISVQLAFGSYMAQVAEVAVNKDGEVSVTRVVCAVDCGQAVNPDTVKAQLEGGVIFGITAALWGEITFDKGRVQQSNFHDYRMLRINETPAIEVHLIASGEAPGGLGEPGTSAIFPAVANAVFAATGQRVRKLPISAAALKQA
ncbi:MAG TPA: xanthine dehydrogenase family protein molybdopterin-binding subunit [Ideonella sp.]|uniref:xanthine dehydrogenase family protein molybdopterin-binding subunit n=1 Tax=Ideonella sp. TaxID=1929293 RepID=UPI002CDF311C|nr:xanthine dehydrogenase family protein molybdopterin-binding subunit [Ideonella sp.]HSI51618.1 xanthine dehydrogenase family protein molybdopterin-binding subunit [Ideonella sp.]